MKEVKYINELKENAKRGTYDTKLDEPQQLSLSHITDPEKSVQWNAEQAAKYNAEVFPYVKEDYNAELIRVEELLKGDLTTMFIGLPDVVNLFVADNLACRAIRNGNRAYLEDRVRGDYGGIYDSIPLAIIGAAAELAELFIDQVLTQ